MFENTPVVRSPGTNPAADAIDLRGGFTHRAQARADFSAQISSAGSQIPSRNPSKISALDLEGEFPQFGN
jgi:hypothetical protein